MNELTAVSVPLFGLVLARVGGVLVSAPVFGARQIPVHTKVGLALVLTLIFTPLQSGYAAMVPQALIPYALLVGRELLIGLAVGFAIGLIFHGIQMGSHLVGVQIGFGLGGVLNPMSNADGGAIDTFYSILATVIFLAANGHHAVIAALARTFELAPIASAEMPAINPIQVMMLVQQLFIVALRIALPAIAALLLADVALGLIGRAAPSMQVMVVGAPVKIGLGLLMLAASTPTTAMLMDAVFRGTGQSVVQLLGGA